MRFALALILLSASACHASESIAVAIFRNFVLIPSKPNTKRTEFEKLELPFFYSASISPIGPTIRLLGVPSESASETEATIWEISDSGGTWTKWHSVPIDARGVFVSDHTWGYIDRGHPRNILVFESAAKSPHKISIAAGLVVDDTVPLVWLKDEKAVILSLATAGVRTYNDQGASVNVVPTGKFTIKKISIETGKITPVTSGEEPTLSPDRKILAFLRGGALWIRFMDTGSERLAYKPSIFGGGVRSMFWLAGSSKLIFNTYTGSEAFGWGSRCSEIDLATNKVRILWASDEGCSAVVKPSFSSSASSRN